MTKADLIRIRAAVDRAIAAVRHPVIIGQTAPLHFASRPPPRMPEYLHPAFGRIRR